MIGWLPSRPQAIQALPRGCPCVGPHWTGCKGLSGLLRRRHGQSWRQKSGDFIGRFDGETTLCGKNMIDMGYQLYYQLYTCIHSYH